MRRWAEAFLAGSLVALAVAPMVVLFPKPPAFGREAACIIAAVAILATVGTAFQATCPRRGRILAWAGTLLAVTVVSAAIKILLARTMAADVPTLDVLPAVFGLRGEDIDDAVLYEGWLEVWLGCGLVTMLANSLRRTRRPRQPFIPQSADVKVALPWNAATILVWLAGWAVLAGAVLDGHRTAAFLEHAVHVTGTIADVQPHPRIRFKATDGTTVEFIQNGFVSRVQGAAVPVAYLEKDPAGSARTDTFWASWTDLLGLLWIGLCFTLSPYYGFRAAFRIGRW